MSFTGYKLYRGVGGLADVDFTTPVASISGAAAAYSLTGAGHLASTQYTYVLRPVKVDLEQPDVSCIITFRTDSLADWEGARPDRIAYLTAEILSGAQIRLRWEYRTGDEAAETFGIYYGNAPGQADGSPNTSANYTKDGQYSTDLTLTNGATYWFAVTAISEDGVESRPIEIGPYVATSAGPPQPTIYTATTFEQ